MSPALKRQRKRKRIDTDGDPEFQVAPMVDVLLVLMLFFMAITSTEVLKKNPNLILADAKNAKRPESNEHKHEITVNVEWNSFNQTAAYTMDQYRADTPDGLATQLAAKHAEDDQAHVVIRADKDVQYSNISDLMLTCGSAGIGTVSFSVLIGGDKTTPPPAPTN